MLATFSKAQWNLAALAGFVFFALPSVALAASFPDVAENTVNYGAVEYLKEKGVVSGYPDGTFQPDKTINRAEALKMVMLATAQQLDSIATLSFPDVSESDWFYSAVRKAFEVGIVEGYPDGTFKPENNINVAESLKIIFLAFKIALPSVLANNPYPDVDKNLWYAKYAEYARSKQLIWALDDGLLHAERHIKRGEFAQILYRLMYMDEKNLEVFPLSTDWPTYTHPTDHYLAKYPFGWKRIDAGKQIIFWKPDEGNKQLSFGRVYPNGATAVFVVDPNENRLSFDDYLSNLNYYTTGITQRLTLNDYPFAAVSITDRKWTDYYFEMPNKSILAVYGEVGEGANRPQLLEELRNIIGSVRYTETVTGVTDRETFLAAVREKILIEGAGQDALGLFKELLLIETDSIGIGTGPVDYYYSAEYDVTMKLERNSDTLLAMSDGKTSAF